MAALAGVNVTHVGYRRVGATCLAGPAPLLGLRTVDDVFIDVATWSGIGRQRHWLDVITNLCQYVDLAPAVAACRQVRPVPPMPRFSVTANFVGQRNYSTPEIKTACAKGITTGCQWAYSADDAMADLNIRIFIEHDQAFVGLRLADHPLHRRPYKQRHVPGSLKPPVAAAMVLLANGASGTHLLDPCCGAGTILIEAAACGMVSVGGDINAGALSAARPNAAAAGVQLRLQQWDARHLPLADGSVDRIATNLPWGREVEVGTERQELYDTICAEIVRVLVPDGRVVLLTNAPRGVRIPSLAALGAMEISLYGQTPTLLLFGS
jgi:23S rRNA G2445 N2-methylase RlmL